MRTIQAHEIIVTDIRTGQKSIFPHAKAASAALGVSAYNIRAAAKGLLKRRPKHPYIFQYGKANKGAFAGKRRRVVRINPETGEKTYYESIVRAAAENYITVQAIGMALRGKAKTAAAHYWEYADAKEGDRK